MKVRKITAAALLAAASVTPQFAAAESDVNNTNTGNAAAALNFRVVIPRVLFLQVGTGTLLADLATRDRITFTPTEAQLLAAGSPEPTPTNDVSGTGGTSGPSGVEVRIFSNVGAVELSATGTAGGLQHSTVPAEKMPWTEIKATATAGTAANGFTAAAIPHPAIADGTPAIPSIIAASGVVRSVGVWTFAYDNAGDYVPGRYDGTVVYTLAPTP